MDDSDGSVNEREFGKLVLHSIPSKEAEEMVVSYLSRMVKNVPAEKLAQRIKKTPFVLSKKIFVKKGNVTSIKLKTTLRSFLDKKGMMRHFP